MKKSVAILNEADDFGRILDWQLFCMEQENLLWGYRESVEWLPGDPLYPYPNRIWFDINGQGNYVRPLVEVLDDFYLGPGVRCEDCQVSWWGRDPCWMCGKKRARDGLLTVEHDGIVTQAHFYFDAWGFVAAANHAAESLRGFSMQMSLFAEGVNDHTWRALAETPDLVSISVPADSRNWCPFERPDVEIELPRPAVAEVAEVVDESNWRDVFATLRYVELPATFDGFGRGEPEMPQMADLGIDYDQFSYRPRWVELMREGRNR